MLIVNNLCTGDKTFSSNLTYLHGRVWVSELDTCIMSHNNIRQLCNFSVNQDIMLPSDHAPVYVVLEASSVNLDTLATRDSRLGDHAVLHYRQSNSLVTNPVKFHNIDPEGLMHALSQHGQPVLGEDIEAEVNDVCNVLYECARNSKTHNRIANGDVLVDRWERLLKENDQSQLW